MDTNQQPNPIAPGMNAAKRLHPEDICVGDDIALGGITSQFASFMWCGADPAMLPPDQVVRITYLPWKSFRPLKVISTCLPFVLCRHFDRTHETFDVRQVQFVRLDPKFAAQVRKRLRDEKSNRCKCGSKKKRRKKRNQKSKK